MSNRLKMILVLSFTGVVSGSVLAAVYTVSYPAIEATRLAEEKRSIYEVVPDAKEYVLREIEGIVYFECLDDSGSIVGIALPAGGNGYQGVIKLMIGLTPDLSKITGIRVLEQLETPGLGGRIAETEFQNQFRGIKTEPALGYVKNKKPEKETDIQAITGATISSRAIVAIINSNVQGLKRVF